MNNTALLSLDAHLSTSTTTTRQPLRVKSNVKAGWISKPSEPPSGLNHGLRVKSNVKAGWISKPSEPPSGLNHGVALRAEVTRGRRSKRTAARRNVRG